MSDPLQKNLMIDYRLDAYRTIFNHAWARRLLEMVDGTKLDPPLFELTVNWRAAVNTHGFPWIMMHSLGGLWQGAVVKKCVTSKFLRVMAAEIPKRMGGKMTNTARNRLAQVLRELNEELTAGIENDPETQMSAEDFWKSFLDKELVEFHVAIWGSQRFCFGALYHAYESYFREVLAIKKGNPDYKFHRFEELVKHVTEEFGPDIADKCLVGDFINISRWTRNALAHNGGKENNDLKKYRKVKEHNIPVADDFLQIMATHNEELISALEQRVTILTQTALMMPEFK